MRARAAGAVLMHIPLGWRAFWKTLRRRGLVAAAVLAVALGVPDSVRAAETNAPHDVIRAVVGISAIIPEDARTAKHLGVLRSGNGVVIDPAQILAAIAVVTMLLGNLAALNQLSLKRMLAYSGIAHTGYLLIPLVLAVSGSGAIAGASIPFYLISYAVTTLAAFGVIVAISVATDRDDVQDLNGLARTRPMLALGFTVALLSLAGVPLTSGFIGKLMIFRDAIEGGFLQLALIGIVASLISIYYYLRPVVAMWFKEPSTSFDLIPASWGVQFTVAVCAIATVALGLFPDWLVNLSKLSVHAILG